MCIGRATPPRRAPIILEICRAVGARTDRLTKGKSMVAEEIALNDHLAKANTGITAG